MTLAYMPHPDAGVERMLRGKGWDVTLEDDKVFECDVAVFTGGADVTPFLYGEKALPGTHFDMQRDLKEISMWRYMYNALPKIGICRGAQFLNVMNGGSLWQHVDQHTTSHEIYTELDKKKEHPIGVTSTHHQMMMVGELGTLLAYATESQSRTDAEMTYASKVTTKDPEVVWYDLTNTLCVQYHPEYTHCPKEGVEYFWDTVDLMFEGK